MQGKNVDFKCLTSSMITGFLGRNELKVEHVLFFSLLFNLNLIGYQ